MRASRCFNVESAPELDRIDAVAQRLQKRARAGRAPRQSRHRRQDASVHLDRPEEQQVRRCLRGRAGALSHARLQSRRSRGHGIGCHIGSQITEIAPYVEAADRIIDLVDALSAKAIALRHIDFGGGLGIRYRDETPPCRTGIDCCASGPAGRTRPSRQD